MDCSIYVGKPKGADLFLFFFLLMQKTGIPKTRLRYAKKYAYGVLKKNSLHYLIKKSCLYFVKSMD